MDIIKNPVIIGLTFGVLTYVYMVWVENEKMKKNKKNKKYIKKKINLLIPLVVTIITWFISYSYFEYKNPVETQLNLPDIIRPSNIPQITPLPLVQIPNYKFVGDVLSASSDPKSFSLITNGITVPTKLPEVLLEMY